MDSYTKVNLPYFVDILGFHGTFWLYGLVMVVEVVYGAISLPENKGQSLVKTEEKMVSSKDNAEGGILVTVWFFNFEFEEGLDGYVILRQIVKIHIKCLKY